MTTNPLLKRILTSLCFSFIASFSFAQTIEKTNLITYYDYPSLQTSTTYNAIGIGTDKNLKLYGSQFIPGKVKSATEKEKGFSTFSGNDMQRGSNLYVERTLSPNLDSLGSRQMLVVSGEPGNQAMKFEVATVADMMSKGLPKDFDVTYSSKMYDEFPLMKSDETKENRRLLGADFKVQGKGMFGIKEPKSYPVFIYSQALESPPPVAEGNAKITASSLFKLKPLVNSGTDKMNEDAPRKEQNMALLDGYIGVYESKPVLMTQDQKTFNGVLGQKNEDDKWADYKNMAFVTFDDKGNILQKDTVAFQYIRRTYYASVVKDFSGREKGFVYFFGGLVTIGGKKEKDPMENNFQIVYLGLDGKIKYKNTFQRGIPTNKMGLSPVMVIEKEGKLLVWNIRSDKVLAESSAEILEFDEKGSMTIKIEKADISASSKSSGANLNSYSDFGRITENPIKTMYDDGKVTIVKQMKERKTKSVPNSVGGTSQEEYFEYGNIMLVTFENTDKFPEARMISLETSFQPVDNNMLDESEKHFNSIITAGNNNIFVNFKDYNLKTMWVNAVKEKEMPLFIPPRSVMKYNYTIDKDSKKAYFVYATPSKRNLKLIKVAY
jgi:hypothetical protein